MPECQECGNTETFYYPVEGIEEVNFREGTDNITWCEMIESYQDGGYTCSACDSDNVIVE